MTKFYRSHVKCFVFQGSSDVEAVYLPGAFPFGTFCSPDDSSVGVALLGFVLHLQDGHHAALECP